MRPDGPRDPVAGPETGPGKPFPLRLDGKVIKGFGRGSSELGIPTANIPLAGLSVGGHEDVESGVYYGWAGLSPAPATPPQHLASASNGTKDKDKYTHMSSEVSDQLQQALAGHKDEHENNASDSAVYPMVMSIGWNPFYKNSKRSVEVHIMQHFDKDFYGCHMNLSVLGFIRPEYDYVSKESLIEDIQEDINVAGRSLARPAYAEFARDVYLRDFANKSDDAQ